MRKILITGAACAALAVAACSDKGADTDGDGKVSTAEAQKELSKGGAVAMTPGMWEVKIKFDSIEAPGLPEAAKAQMSKAMSEMSIKSCLTKEQAEKPGADFFGGFALRFVFFNAPPVIHGIEVSRPLVKVNGRNGRNLRQTLPDLLGILAARGNGVQHNGGLAAGGGHGCRLCPAGGLAGGRAVRAGARALPPPAAARL